MKLDNFQAVFAAAQEVALMGESLVCEGNGVTVVVKPIEVEATPQIEVIYINGSRCTEQTSRFDVTTFPVADFTRMSVAKHYRALLKGGTNLYGS